MVHRTTTRPVRKCNCVNASQWNFGRLHINPELSAARVPLKHCPLCATSSTPPPFTGRKPTGNPDWTTCAVCPSSSVRGRRDSRNSTCSFHHDPPVLSVLRISYLSSTQLPQKSKTLTVGKWKELATVQGIEFHDRTTYT